METIASVKIETEQGPKTLSVVCCDIRELDKPLDVMTVSAFCHDYVPYTNTIIGALDSKGISVSQLGIEPALDLRNACNVWLSKEAASSALPIRRIGCVEMIDLFRHRQERKNDDSFLSTIKAYFHLLDLAVDTGIEVKTLGLSALGTGSQGISDSMIFTPILNECVRFLQRNECIREIIIIERNVRKASNLAKKLESSYSLMSSGAGEKPAELEDHELPLAFISYSSKDRNVADNLCAKLETNGIRVWYAPRNVDMPDYASAIVRAIRRCSLFVVILSQNSLASDHVLNEIDLAFQRSKSGLRFFPLKLDNKELGDAFLYYLSRQHWMDATLPPLEIRLDEFVAKIKKETGE